MIGSVIFLFACVLLLWYVFLTRKFNHWKLKNVPYLKPVPLFGNFLKTFTFQKNIGDALKEIHLSTNDPILGFFICDEPCLLIRNPDIIKQVLVKDFHIFADRNVIQNTKSDPIGTNILFFLKNVEWKEMRRRLTPVFSSAKIKAMYPLISEASKNLILFLENHSGQNVDVREVTAKFTTDAITSTAFGINANCFTDEDAEFRQVSRRIFNYDLLERAISTSCYFVAPSLVRLFGLRFVDKKSCDFMRDVFWKTMREREEKKISRNDLLDILIELRKQGTFDDFEKFDDKIVAQAVQFFLGGYETTSSTVSFGLFELALHPEVQNQLRDEITQRKKIGELTYEAIQEMEYLDMCTKEILRKYPVLPFLDRKCSTDYLIPGTDVFLERNTPIFISLLGLHFDEENWPKPDVFDPTRFTPENVQSRPQFAYMPFGEGPRNCIGARYGLLSSKMVLARIISNFEVELADKTQRSMEFDKKGFLLAPNKQLLLKFHKL